MIKSHLKIIVLKTLEKKDMTGYDLVKEIHSFTQHWKPSFGSIYPLLKDLHNNGLVEVRQEGRRKIYSITKKGRQTVNDIFKTKEEIFRHTMDNLKNLEVICSKKEMDFIHAIHCTLKNNFVPFREVTKEMQEFTEVMINLNAAGKIAKNHKEIKKILSQATNNLKKIYAK